MKRRPLSDQRAQELYDHAKANAEFERVRTILKRDASLDHLKFGAAIAGPPKEPPVKLAVATAPPAPKYKPLMRLSVRPEFKPTNYETWRLVERDEKSGFELPDPAKWFNDVYQAARTADACGKPVRLRVDADALVLEVQE